MGSVAAKTTSRRLVGLGFQSTGVRGQETGAQPQSCQLQQAGRLFNLASGIFDFQLLAML